MMGQGFRWQLFVVLFAVITLGTVLMAEEKKPDKTGGGFVGAGVGYAHQFGRTYEVDAVSGATASAARETIFADPGFTSAVFGDFGIVTVGPGSFGLRVGIDVSVPGPYMGFSLEPRYRFKIITQHPHVTSVEPWLGVGVTTGWIEQFSTNVYMNFAGSVGTDIRFGQSPWYLGLQIDLNVVNFLAASEVVTLADGSKQEHASRWNNVLTKLHVSYRFY